MATDELKKTYKRNGGPMFINEYGNRNDPTIILLAPMITFSREIAARIAMMYAECMKEA